LQIPKALSAKFKELLDKGLQNENVRQREDEEKEIGGEEKLTLLEEPAVV
jgi:hypothetical protein